MPAAKRIPEDLQAYIKSKDMIIQEAKKFLASKGIKVSTGWLSLHKEQWQKTFVAPDGEEYVFKEDDESFDTDLATRIRLYRGEPIKKYSEKKHFRSKTIRKFLKRSSEGCAAFAKECLVWKGQPIILQDYQKRMIDGWLGSKPTVYPIGRGGGKDFTLAIFLAWYCVCFPNTRVMIVCPAYRQVKTFIEENFALLIQTSSVLFDSIAEKKEEEFRFTNGSVVFTYGATSYIKGKHNLHFIFANEAGEIPDHVYENVLLPMLGVDIEKAQGHFCAMGVPNGQVGFFWRAYTEGSTDPNDPDAKYYVIHLPTEVNKYYPKKQLELNREIMSHDSFLQEHMAEFLRVEDALFTSKLLDKIKKEYEISFATVDHEHFDYYLGLDWGRSSDYTVPAIVSVNKESKAIRLEYITGMRRDFPSQIEWILEADRIYRFKNIVTEYMGLGIPPSDTLKKELGSERVQFFTPSAANWFTAFTNMRDKAEAGLLEIPAGQSKLLRQLRLMQFTVRGSKLTVKSENKDDYAQAFAMAIYSIRPRSKPGVAGSI